MVSVGFGHARTVPRSTALCQSRQWRSDKAANEILESDGSKFRWSALGAAEKQRQGFWLKVRHARMYHTCGSLPDLYGDASHATPQDRSVVDDAVPAGGLFGN